MFDKEEPDDNIRLEVSVIHVPPIDWSDLLLTDLIEDAALSKDSRGLTNRGPFREAKRRDLELAWLEVDFIDPDENRKAHSRICMARGPGVYSFITIDFWPEDRRKVNSVWNDVLGTLKLGEFIQDPTRRSVMN